MVLLKYTKLGVNILTFVFLIAILIIALLFQNSLNYIKNISEDSSIKLFDKFQSGIELPSINTKIKIVKEKEYNVKYFTQK